MLIIDPKNDYAFKEIFRQTDILTNFLNAALETNIKIENFIDRELPPIIASKKQSILDVLCRDDKGDRYIIEMQQAKESSFIKRAQYYAARAYGNALDKKQSYGNLKEIKFIAIINFILFPGKIDYKSTHGIFDKETFEKDLQDFSFVFIELPKFNKTLIELKNDLDRWAYFFKNASKINFEEKLTISNTYPIFKEAFIILERISQNEDQLFFYQAVEKQEKDQLNRIYGEREKFKKILKDQLPEDKIEELINNMDIADEI